jgi:hypothetical protein
MTKKKVHTYRGISFTVPSRCEGFSPSLKRIENLLDMAAALRNGPPPAFGMANYARVLVDDEEIYNQFSDTVKEFLGYGGSVSNPINLTKIREEKNICGTSCCALGTAAWHGIGRMTRDMDWEQYSAKNYGMKFGSELWLFLFGGDWRYADDTPEGAAARILKFVTEGTTRIVKNGIVIGGRSDWDWSDLIGRTYRYEAEDLARVSDFYKDYLTVEVK